MTHLPPSVASHGGFHVDYDAHFPPEYQAGHMAGLKLLRVAARVRSESGREVVGPLYAALGARLWDAESQPVDPAARDVVEPVLATVGLPTGLADALEDESWDAELRSETKRSRSPGGTSAPLSCTSPRRRAQRSSAR